MLKSASRTSALFLLIGMTAGLGVAQQVPSPDDGAQPSANATSPEYEVASVKQNKSGKDMMSIRTKPDGFAAENIRLLNLISNAYGIREDLISGAPGWTNTVGFDVDAKVAGPDVEALKKLSNSQRESMLKPVLAERFGLKLHGETKTLPIYDLVVAKGGPKLTHAAPEPPPPPDAKPGDAPAGGFSMMMRPGQIDVKDAPVSSITNELSYLVHRTVLDKTGLAGKYDWTLKWTEDEGVAAPDNGSESSAPSLFTAVQEQLGLRLVSTKGAVETLVIDHVEMPKDN